VFSASPTGRRILIVDDNEDAADALADLLKAAGHTTRVAHDGLSALKIVDLCVPEIALLDIGLPVMDRYELARRLQELEQFRTLPLVAITGYGQQTDLDRHAAQASMRT
jgi:CheY-like chemotaxis protein